MAEILQFDQKVSKEQVHEATEQLNATLEAIKDDNELMKVMASLLDLPDEQFILVAPGILESFKMSLNNPNDKLALVQSLNAAGYHAEDLVGSLAELNTAIDELDTSEPKKDFLKECFMAISNSVSSTEGIAKRIISIPIELCHENAKIPQYAHQSDSGMDVYALEDITIGPGETVLVPTGIKVALPPGYELQVRPKSGRALKTKLRIANTPGTIDQGYRDEIKIIIENVDPPIRRIHISNWNIEDTDPCIHFSDIDFGQSYTIGKGEKFAQLILMEVPKAAFYRVDSVHDIGDDRGGGFGSTGIK